MSRKSRKPANRERTRPAAKTDPLDAVIDASAHALGLKIDKKWKPAIRAHLQVTLHHGTSVTEFKLPDDVEPAPVFES